MDLIVCIREQARSHRFSAKLIPATKRHGAGFAAARHDGVASFLHENRYVQKTVTSNTHHPLESG
ncbi:hypothetical protein [Pseudomonas syringae]|uniref:hypothetical protein n=1 Tax=Pseudomonas syringae TaxID=317 RepID=UPI001F354C95|nr:hypothetical protein [Pseudomonas syringae]MCF5704301.1 hypothetical protein [Pseudomonas syringae]